MWSINKLLFKQTFILFRFNFVTLLTTALPNVTLEFKSHTWYFSYSKFRAEMYLFQEVGKLELGFPNYEFIQLW